jgi:Mg-chelatase subunit ChlD
MPAISTSTRVRRQPDGSYSGSSRDLVNNVFLRAPGLLVFLFALLWVSTAQMMADAKPCVNCNKKNQQLDPYSQDNNYDPAQSIGGNTGNVLQGGTGNTTLQVGTESTLLQTGTTGALLQAGVEREGAPANVLFLIDSSQSMKEKIKVGAADAGRSEEKKMEAAKKVLEQALSRIPNEVNLGLRVFGNGFRGDFTDCQQSTLLVPIGKNNRRAIIESVRNMAPYGLTPLTYALMQAEADLRYCNGPKTVILISDGAETCGGDPCAYIDRLSRIGVKMKVDIVGLGLRRDKDAQEQLNCIAQKSGGKYYNADTSADLVDSITNSVKSAISGKVLTKITTPAMNDKGKIPADFAMPKDPNKLPADLAPIPSQDSTNPGK